MNPTPEQVAQWAREEGGELSEEYELEQIRKGVWLFTADELTRLVTRAMAEQAEADAKLCDARKAQSRNSLVRSGIAVAAADIRANAPKVTT